MISPTIDPHRSVFLVMDMQNSVLGQFEGTDPVVQCVKETIAKARGTGMKIGYVRLAFNDLDYMRMPQTDERLVDIAQNRRLFDGDPSTEIHSDLEPQLGDIVVRKTRVGAFSTTDLEKKLRSISRDTIVLAGARTSGVVLSTLLEAADRDFKLFVLSDGCFDPNPELHNMLLEKLFPRYATVTNSGSFEDVVKSRLG